MIVLLDRITHDRITYDRVSCTSHHDRFSNGVTHDRLTLDRVTRTLLVAYESYFPRVSRTFFKVLISEMLTFQKRLIRL